MESPTSPAERRLIADPYTYRPEVTFNVNMSSSQFLYFSVVASSVTLRYVTFVTSRRKIILDAMSRACLTVLCTVV